MPRPPKCRRVAFLPGITYFKPAGIPLRSLEEVRLSVDEVEAIRLKDLEGLEQEQGASKMNVSRPTFQRIVSSARQKLADAILNGKAIRIEGGNFEMTELRLRCNEGHEWSVPPGAITDNTAALCPTCGAPPIASAAPRGRGWRQGERQGKGRARRWTENI